MEQKFKVIYSGKLQGDADVKLIATRFAEKFKVSLEKASKIIKANKEVVLHPGADHVKAYKLKSALENLGLQMRLERVEIFKAVEKNTSNKNADKIASTVTNSSKDEPAEKPPSNKTEKPKVAANISSPDWALEPIQKESSEAENGEEVECDSAAGVKQQYVDLRIPSKVLKKKPVESDEAVSITTKNDDNSDSSDSSGKEQSGIMVFVKQFGGLIAAGLVGVLFLAKKFGILKFLKIGGLMAAAAYAGYSPEEACMGNGDCEDAISDQIDACWSYSELDHYDWDNMSDEQYFELKPQVEENFIACFRYENSGERVLESPIELRFDLIDMCDMLSNPVSGCLEMAENQVKACYDSSDIIEPIKKAEYDYYATMMTDMQYFVKFYGCFEDHNGNMLFAEFVNELESVDMNEAL